MRNHKILLFAAVLFTATAAFSAFTPLWRIPPDAGIRYALTAGNDLLCVNSAGALAKYRFDNGAFVSSAPLPALPLSRPCLSGEILVFCGADGNVYAVNWTTGAVLWSVALPARGYSEPAVFENTVFIGTMADTCAVLGLALTDGRELFRATVPQPVHVPIAVSEGRVIAATAGGEVYTFEFVSGRLLSVLRTQGEFIGQKLALSNGRLLMAPSLGHRKGESVDPVSGKAHWSVSFVRSNYADEDQLNELHFVEPSVKARLFKEYLAKTPVMARVAAEKNAWDAFMAYGPVTTSGWCLSDGEAAMMASEPGWESKAACQLVRVELSTGKVLGQTRRIVPATTAASCIAPVYTSVSIIALFGGSQLTALDRKSGAVTSETVLPAEGTGPILAAKEAVALVTRDGGVSAFQLDDAKEVIGSYGMSQNFPNPFNPVTTFKYQVPRQSRVLLTVFNVRGQEIVRLIDGLKDAGNHAVLWDGKDANKKTVPSGVYIAIMKSGNYKKVVKMTLLK